MAKLANKTHKDRVNEFNTHLESLSEHHDIPKVIYDLLHRWQSISPFVESGRTRIKSLPCSNPSAQLTSYIWPLVLDVAVLALYNQWQVSVGNYSGSLVKGAAICNIFVPH